VECAASGDCLPDVEACGMDTHSCVPIPVPATGQYLFCWDLDPDGDPLTINSTCDDYDVAGGCNYWGPTPWQYQASVPTPHCGSCNWVVDHCEPCPVQDPVSECCLSNQVNFYELTPAERICLTQGLLIDLVP
jgi:hypothetical protein